ncbi:MAG: 4Fe-4S dicluster domain-containing protein [Clostridiales bacterium]|nr:4Fe-4S dicluster domain-containing protein [Clostridiales bacterium]
MADPAVMISKAEILKMLAELMKDATVFAPASNGKKLDYMPVRNVEDIVFGDDIPYKSPKEIFFPRTEKIITFKDGDAEAEISTEKYVLFGARPCDLEALDIMRKVFTEGRFKDPFFEERYNNTLIIGVGCVDKKPGCFCDERETDMGYSDKCDLFLGAQGAEDYFQALHLSEKGRETLGRYIDGLRTFQNTGHEFKPAHTLSIDATEEELFDKIDWESLVETCQGCGMCTYICPTCHCFGFKDVDEGGCASRYRNWDSCMFPKFTLHASGHNPREERHERYRQRFAHKYLYVKKNFGAVACTGCGRCVRACPAGVNIKAIAEKIGEDLQ